MRLNIEHHTHYAYPNAVGYTIQQLRLTPQDGFGQRVRNWTIRVSGRAQPYADAFGNLSHTLVLDTPHSEINITACGEVETGLDTPPPTDLLPLAVYLRSTPLTAVDKPLAELAERFAQPGGMGEDEVRALIQAVKQRLHRRCNAAGAPVGAAKAFAAGEVACQDHAHIFIACCRHVGLPARYVSGYRFVQDTGRMESHSWADVWLEGAGWLGFDPELGQRANSIHVRLASGLDDHDACPVNGMLRPRGQGAMTCSLHAHSMQQQQ